jgi:hypothetical protein
MSKLKFRSDYICNAEWASNPETVEIYLISELEEVIQRQAQALKDSGGNVMITWWVGSYEFFDYEGESFEPEYRLDGGHLHVYDDGTFSFHFPFKYSGEEGLSQTLRWSDGVLMEEAA